MRLRTAVFGLLFAVALPVIAAAQTHPCDQTPPVNPSTKTGFAGGICWDQEDADHVAFTAAELATIQLKVLIDGVVVKTVTGPTPVGGANAAGLFYYRVPTLAASKAAHQISYVFASTEGDGAASTAYSFRVIGSVPSAGVSGRIEPR